MPTRDLQELRLLLACIPARTTSSLLLLTQLLEVRLDGSRVELEANAALVVKGDRDELQRRIHRRDGPIVLDSCAYLSRLSNLKDVAANGAGFVHDLPEGGGEVLGGHRGNGG
jgi:hypothetical protein